MTPYNKLREMYRQNITVSHISEPLTSFDVSKNIDEALQYMNQNEFDVIGVRQNEMIIGYLDKNDARPGTCGESKKSFEPYELVSESMPLLELFFMLKEQTKIFVLEKNKVAGIVTKADLQKPPVRMLLFGLLSLLEMHLLRIIRDNYEEESWNSYLSGKRIEKAKELFKERQDKNENIDLVDCLQLCDKKNLIIKSDVILNKMELKSKTSAEKLFTRIEKLRNNLAHSQDISKPSWDEVFEVVKKSEKLLEKCEEL